MFKFIQTALIVFTLQMLYVTYLGILIDTFSLIDIAIYFASYGMVIDFYAAERGIISKSFFNWID